MCLVADPHRCQLTPLSEGLWIPAPGLMERRDVLQPTDPVVMTMADKQLVRPVRPHERAKRLSSEHLL